MRISDWSSDVCSSDLVQQLALREQHHESANGIVQQNGLHFTGGVQAWSFDDFVKADAQFLEQQPNNRRSVRGFGDEGSFSHGLYPFSYKLSSITSLPGRRAQKLRACPHLAVLLPMTQPSNPTRPDVTRPAFQP